MKDILQQKIQRLHFNKNITVGKLTFHIAPDTGNTWVFHADIKNTKDQEFAQKFAKDLGMAICTNSLVTHMFVAWCTDDTYVYILPYKLNEWRSKS